jgi:uncharacterized membrane protein (DUF2068 family)
MIAAPSDSDGPSRQRMTSTIAAPNPALRAVALLEAVKGLIVFGAGFGLLTLLHRDVRRVAEALVTRLHIDPEEHYAGIFLDAANHVTDAKLWALAVLAAAYTALRWVEAYGLWLNRRWAAWLGAAGGAFYVPVEFYELWHKPGPIKAATLLLNLTLVVYLVWMLRQGRGAHPPVT